MSFTIGRLDLDVPDNYDFGGDTLTISGKILASSVAAAIVIRDQLRGLIRSQWEQHVPVVWTDDMTITGWYRVAGGQVSAVEGLSNAVGTFTYSLQLVQLGSSTGCKAETSLAEVQRQTSHTVTETWWYAIPDSATGHNSPGYVDSTRTGPGGSVKYFESTSATLDGRYGFNLDPADWYEMAPYVKIGGEYVTGPTAPNDTSDWEIGNGLIKITPGTGGLLALTGPASTPTGWGTASHWKVGYWSGSTFVSVTTIDRIIPLSITPNRAALRLDCSYTEPATSAPAWQTVGIEMLRGEWMARLALEGDGNYLGVETVASTPATAQTGGMYQTTADGDGNRWVVATSKALTTVLTGPSRLYYTTGLSYMDVGLGIEWNGASSPDDKASIRDQYFELVNEVQQVVVG